MGRVRTRYRRGGLRGFGLCTAASRFVHGLALARWWIFVIFHETVLCTKIVDPTRMYTKNSPDEELLLVSECVYWDTGRYRVVAVRFFAKTDFVLFVMSQKVREVVARTVQEVLEPPARLSASATGYWWDGL